MGVNNEPDVQEIATVEEHQASQILSTRRRALVPWLAMSAAVLVLVVGLLSLKLFLSTAESSSAASSGGVVLLPSAGQPPALVAGGDAPDFTLHGLAGPDLSLSDFRGQVVMVNFWATWCPPCRSEMPAMQQVYAESKDKGFTIIAVNIQEAQGPISDFVSKLGLTFPIALDPNGDVTKLYGIYGLPSSYFVDRMGRITEVHVGALTKAEILTKVNVLLASPVG